jgi:hypothetical protein
MTNAISPNSSTLNTAIDQNNRPMTKDVMNKVQFQSEFKDLIEQYNQIKEEFVNLVKELAESHQNHQPQLTVPDLKSSTAFQEILKKHNLSEKEGLDLLKKVEEKIQQQKDIKV